MFVPRRCVGKPTWVKVAGMATGTISDETGDYFYRDSAGSEGPEQASWSAKVRRG